MLHFESYNLSREQMQSISITLLGTAHCHLCEEAERLLESVLSRETFHPHRIVPHKIDVMNDDNLYENYGIKIPVLQLKLNQELLGELYWPFDSNELQQFLDQNLEAAFNRQ